MYILSLHGFSLAFVAFLSVADVHEKMGFLVKFIFLTARRFCSSEFLCFVEIFCVR